MSKNLIVLFIIILLIVGGFGIYTYDQSNQAKKEVEEKIFELGSKDELVLELKENIQEKEKQIEELKANLVKGEKDLEKEYTDKLSELTEEKAKLEALLTEKEETIKTIEKQKEESEQIVILKDELVLELKENIQEKEKQIEELKANLVKGEKDLEEGYATKISELMAEKGQLEALLIEQEGILQTKDREKEELISKLENSNNQINELKDKLVQQETEGEKDYVAELSALTEEKSTLETQLKTSQGLLSEKESAITVLKQQNEESEKSIMEKDNTVAELSESIKGYENQIKEINELMAQEGKEKEAGYAESLALLTEEKSTLETQLKTSQGLLSEKESAITVLKQQNEESEKSIMEKDNTVAELSESIKGYENQIKEINELMAQEGKEKEAGYAESLALLTEEKSTLETQLKTSQGLLSEKESAITVLKQQNEESEKSIMEKDKTVAELSESIKGYENQIKEINELMAQEGKEKEAGYAESLALLTEEKSTLETQLKTSQGLLSEKESAITVLKQQNEESEKSIMETDKTVAELSESIKGYENLVTEIREQMAQEGKEKEAGYAESLALLKESKDIIEAKLAEAIKKNIPDYYEVMKGDSLWKIAERFYNAGGKWIRIFEANMDKIKNPSLIYPYQRLTIPKE